MKEYVEMGLLLDAISVSKLDYLGVADVICRVPSADVAPVVHGEWVKITDVDIRLMGRQIKEVHYKCSVCGGESCFDTNYCPHCGARMDGAK